MYLTKVILIYLGATWSTPEPFYTLPGALDRNRIIPALNGNDLIFPCYNSTPIPSSFILRLSSRMSILSHTDIKQSDYLIQPTVIRLPNSSQLRAFFRDKRGEWIYYADSNDDGSTWTIPKPTSLPNNNAAIEAYVLKSGAVIISFDNCHATNKVRTPLTVALSYDNGITWPYHRDIQAHYDDNATYAGEFSYPSILQSFWSDSDDNDIHIVYTYNRLTIKYRRFNEKWIKQGN
jgi:predicted neuraminidase